MVRGGAAAVLVLLTGCAAMNEELLDAHLPEPPSSWQALDGASDIPAGDWVAAFNDPQLETLISEAMSHNNSLLAAAKNLESARATARIARADLLPSLNASPSASRNAIVTDPSIAAQTGGGGAGVRGLRAKEIEERFGVDLTGDGKLDGLDLNGDGVIDAPLPNRRVYINNFSLGAQVSWELDLWGRIADTTRAAYRDARASRNDYEAARLSIAGAVVQSWFGLIEARQQRELSDRDTEARQRNLDSIERRYERGVASSLDVRLARSALASTKATLAFRQQREKESARRLEVLLGRYPAAELTAAPSLPSLPPLSGAGAPVEILSRRPDLIAAEERMEAAGLRARAARKQLLPSITLSSRLSTSGPELNDVIDPERLAGNIAAGLFQPLFQGGRLRANSSRAKAIAEASILNYTQTALNAFEDAENAIAAEGFLALREEALKIAFEEAAASEDLTERRYLSGAASIFNLLDAQSRRISAESQYIQATRERVGNRVSLYLAIGGDFLVDPNTVATINDNRPRS